MTGLPIRAESGRISKLFSLRAMISASISPSQDRTSKPGEGATSCRSMMSPGRARPAIFFERPATRRLPASRARRLKLTQNIPASRSGRQSRGPVTPTGGRKASGVTPIVPSMCCVLPISSRRARVDLNMSAGEWLYEWFPISWPRSRIRRTRSGRASARFPVTKNAARMPSPASRSRSAGVVNGSGPSSKVRETERPREVPRKVTGR